MKKIFLTLSALSFLVVMTHAQKNVYLNIQHKLGASNFALNQASQNDMSHNFKTTRLDYYMSSFKIIHDGGKIMNVPSHYIFAKGSNNVNDLLGNFNVTNVEGIKFSIGVEDPVNTADPSLQPASHPLSFKSPSMHWGWATGYTFVALEGYAGNNFGKKFEMHCFFNPNYFEQTHMLNGVTNGNDININLNADITQALKGIDVNAGPIYHGDNYDDLKVLQNFRDFVFKPSAGSPTDIKEMATDKMSLYPNPTTGNVYINHTGNNEPTQVVVTDIFGRVTTKQQFNNNQNIDLSMVAKGFYMIQLFDAEQRIIAQQKITLQ